MPSAGRLSRKWRAHGQPDLHVTHRLAAAATLTTTALFPVRSSPITFHARIRITENSGTHEGLVFELGGSGRGVALWVESEKIGFHAGVAGTAGGADAIYDHGAELPVGWSIDLVAACIPATGDVFLALNRSIIRAKATNGTFSSTWGNTGDGSFADAVNGNTLAVVPAGSLVAPTGFAVTSKLTAYQGQVPRLFL